jgi:hypothetical protein
MYTLCQISTDPSSPKLTAEGVAVGRVLIGPVDGAASVGSVHRICRRSQVLHVWQGPSRVLREASDVTIEAHSNPLDAFV